MDGYEFKAQMVKYFLTFLLLLSIIYFLFLILTDGVNDKSKELFEKIRIDIQIFGISLKFN